jgi:hypothetical protein
VLRKADDLNVEWLTGLKRESTLFLFGSPTTTLTGISHAFTLIESRIEVKGNISAIEIARQQIEFEAGCIIIRSTLNVDHTA